MFNFPFYFISTTKAKMSSLVAKFLQKRAPTHRHHGREQPIITPEKNRCKQDVVLQQVSVDDQLVNSRPNLHTPGHNKQLVQSMYLQPEGKVGMCHVLKGVCGTSTNLWTGSEQKSQSVVVDPRPRAWSSVGHDDVEVTELWGRESMRPQVVGRHVVPGKLLRLPLVHAAVPYDAVALKVSHLTGCSLSQMKFSTPVDFYCSSSRSLLVKDVVPEQLDKFQRNVEASFLASRVKVGVAQPLEWVDNPFLCTGALPNLHYSMVLRNIGSTYSKLEREISQLKHRGFLNYSTSSRFGMDLFRLYSVTHDLMRREYFPAIMKLLKGLCEGNGLLLAEIRKHEDNVQISCPTQQSGIEWRYFAERIDKICGDNDSIFRLPFSGLYKPHHRILKQIVERGEQCKGDGAQLLRESIHRSTLCGIIQSAVDVHFNAFLSLRVSALGEVPVVGDLVCLDRAFRMGHIHWQTDHFPGLDVLNSNCCEETVVPQNLIKVIESDEEARNYLLSDVVLPTLGYHREGSALMYPNHRIGKVAFLDLASSLQCGAVEAMRLAAPPTYRRMACVPLSLDYTLWNDTLGMDPRADVTITDTENVRHQCTKYTDLFGITTCRPCLTSTGSRQRLQQWTQGLTVRLKCELPRGVAVSSLIRQVCVVDRVEIGSVSESLRALQRVPNTYMRNTRPRPTA